jgi:general transcription factor 3C polypeptide 3 (transcription factor C subunit 4)
MNQAMFDQGGSTVDIQNLISTRMEFDDEEIQNDEDDMLLMDLALPQEDLNMYKNLPNFNLKSTMQLKSKKKKKNRQDVAYPSLPEELNLLMQKANMEYINGENAEAISTLKKVIQNRPDAHEAWLSLAMIRTSQKEYHRAAQCKLMAAHLSPRNHSLWKEVGILLKELCDFDQAIYCFRNAVITNPDDLECHFELTALYEEKGDIDSAQSSYESILNTSPLDKKAIKSLAKIYMGRSMINDAIGLFQKLIYADQVDPLPMNPNSGFDEEGEAFVNPSNIKPQRMGFEELYMLLELHLENRLFSEGIEYVEIGLHRLLGLSDSYTILNPQHYSAYYFAVPLQLVVKIGICLMHLGKENSANFLISKLYEFPPSEYVDSYFEVGEAHFDKKQYLLALQVFKILENNNLGDPVLLQTKLGDCYMQLEDLEKALQSFQSGI